MLDISTRGLAKALMVATLLAPATAFALHTQENPPASAVVTLSGVQLFSGWKCDPGVITFRVDGGPPEEMASGTARGDTKSEQYCGNDGFNGYGALINVNRPGIGDGTHVVRFYDDGVQFAQSTFEVVTLGAPFLLGKSGSVEMFDFPNPGEGVTLEWSPGKQNFEIVAFCEGDDCPSPCPSDMEPFGAFCIDKVLRPAKHFTNAVRDCDADRRDLCTLDQIFACDVIDVSAGGVDLSCGGATDSGVEIWTGTVAPAGGSTTSATEHTVSYVGSTNSMKRKDYDTSLPYFCCSPAR